MASRTTRSTRPSASETSSISVKPTRFDGSREEIIRELVARRLARCQRSHKAHFDAQARLTFAETNDSLLNYDAWLTAKRASLPHVLDVKPLEDKFGVVVVEPQSVVAEIPTPAVVKSTHEEKPATPSVAPQTVETLFTPSSNVPGTTTAKPTPAPVDDVKPDVKTNVTSVNAKPVKVNQPAEIAAKEELQVLSRVGVLRRSGLWSATRLPLCADPPRAKSHWDYVLEEMKWMWNDFDQERRYKKVAAKKMAMLAARGVIAQREAVEKIRADKVREHKRRCADVARIVREFWSSADRIVKYKNNEIVEMKKRRALDQHLNHIVAQSEKFSSMLAPNVMLVTRATRWPPCRRSRRSTTTTGWTICRPSTSRR